MNEEMKRAVLEEARLIQKDHPSKDARFFAQSVIELLESDNQTSLSMGSSSDDDRRSPVNMR